MHLSGGLQNKNIGGYPGNCLMAHGGTRTRSQPPKISTSRFKKTEEFNFTANNDVLTFINARPLVLSFHRSVQLAAIVNLLKREKKCQCQGFIIFPCLFVFSFFLFSIVSFFFFPFLLVKTRNNEQTAFLLMTFSTVAKRGRHVIKKIRACSFEKGTRNWKRKKNRFYQFKISES